MRSKHTRWCRRKWNTSVSRSEEHTSELQSQSNLVCRLLLEKKKNFEKASRLPEHRSYDERFSAYELSYCEGREREAYDRLRTLYQREDKERLPRLLNQLRVMEERLKIPVNERIIP